MLVLTGRTDKAATDWLRQNGLRWMTKPAEPEIIAMTLKTLLAAGNPDGGDERPGDRKVSGSP